MARTCSLVEPEVNLGGERPSHAGCKPGSQHGGQKSEPASKVDKQVRIKWKNVDFLPFREKVHRAFHEC